MAKEQQKDVIFRFNNPIYLYRKVHGYFAFTGANQSIGGTLNTYAHITNGTNDLFAEIQSNAGIDKVNDTFVFNPSSYPAASKAHMSFHYEIYGNDGVNRDYQVRVYNVTKAAEVPITSFATSDGANNYTRFGGRAYCTDCEVGDVFRMELRPLTGNFTFTVVTGNVWIELNHWVKI